ncbi:MAG: hypothetical protein FJ386_06435 [Verrucomicrobia bacterium]|nr:hypothetical protein [Verrucomicrobiota bacterium]
MASHPGSMLKTGASWFVSACLLIVVGGLLLLAYGLWRTPMPRPEVEEFRQFFATRHAALLQLADSPAATANRGRLPDAAAITGLLEDARKVHTEAIERLVDRDVTIWNWSRAIATSHRDTEQQREYWYVFHSAKFDLFKLEVRDLTTRELLHAFRHEKEGSVTFRRLKDGASFVTHTNGALASVSVPLADGRRVQVDWNPDGSIHERRAPAKEKR